jgi:hypothetical protein
LFIGGLCLLALAGAGGVFAYYHSRPTGPTVTYYVDSNLEVYQCSRPIRAKPGFIPTLPGLGDHGSGRIKGLVPANMAKAKKYCHYSGIE